jgi:hypothetical protein
VVAVDIEWVTTSTEEAAVHQGVTSVVATEIEGLSVLGVTEIGRGIAGIGDLLISLLCSFEAVSKTRIEIDISLTIYFFGS